MAESIPSRRQFMVAIGELASVSWVALNWTNIAYAAEQAHKAHDMQDMSAPPSSLTALTTAEAAEVDAIANLIVPGGAKPAAREARVIYFIDNALGSFFAAQLPSLRQGLIGFSSAYATRFGADKTFAASPEAQQTAWLQEVEKAPFFNAVRQLTILGLIALPKYGGNAENMGWNLLGVEDNHFWEPPFGYYDRDYPGFQPYPGTKPYTA